jgi:glutamine synthetase type III
MKFNLPTRGGITDEDILDYALISFAFLLPFNGEFSFQEWVKNIKNAYDLANLQTNAVVRTIQKYNGKIIRKYGTSRYVIG